MALYDLERLGIDLLSTHAAEVERMSKDGSRIAFRQMMAVFAQYDRTMLVQRLRVARLRKREATGRCEGRKPYGARDGEAKVLREIRAWHAEGVSSHENRANLPKEYVDKILSIYEGTRLGRQEVEGELAGIRASHPRLERSRRSAVADSNRGVRPQ